MPHKTEMNLQELSDRSGMPGRTIRLYISQGLLDGPLRSGRNAAYGLEHLERLQLIRKFQQEGLTLVQIRHALAGENQPSALPNPVSWRQYQLSPDVQVLVKEDISPWRAKIIRDGLAQLNERLNSATAKEEEHGI